MMNDLSWKLIDKYFVDNPNNLVAHHLESYNSFFNKDINRVFRENNPIRFIEREDESKQTENTSENKLAPINNNFKPNVLKDTIGGIYHEYYKNGNIKVKGVYKNKKRDGDWSYFYENGKLWSWGEYQDGKRNGVGSVYYENGVLKMEGNYLNDKRSGLWKFFDKKGKTIKEVKF